MPYPYKNNPDYWLKELDRQEKRAPMTNQRLARPVASRASSGWNPLRNEADRVRNPNRLADFARQQSATPRAAPMAQPRPQRLAVPSQEGRSDREKFLGLDWRTRQDILSRPQERMQPAAQVDEEGWRGDTPPQWVVDAYEPSVIVRGQDVYRKFPRGPLEGYEYLEDSGGPMSLAEAKERMRGQERPEFVDVPRGDGGYFEQRHDKTWRRKSNVSTYRKYLGGELAGREFRLSDLSPTSEQVSERYAPDLGTPGGIRRISTKGDIETSTLQTQYKLAQYGLMAKQHLAPFMTTTTDDTGAPIRVLSEEGSKLKDKYMKISLTDPTKAERLLREGAERSVAKIAKEERLSAMSPEELDQFIAEEEASERLERMTPEKRAIIEEETLADKLRAKTKREALEKRERVLTRGGSLPWDETLLGRAFRSMKKRRTETARERKVISPWD